MPTTLAPMEILWLMTFWWTKAGDIKEPFHVWATNSLHEVLILYTCRISHTRESWVFERKSGFKIVVCFNKTVLHCTADLMGKTLLGLGFDFDFGFFSQLPPAAQKHVAQWPNDCEMPIVCAPWLVVFWTDGCSRESSFREGQQSAGNQVVRWGLELKVAASQAVRTSYEVNFST